MKVWRFSASEDKFSLESYIVEAHEEEDGPVRQCEAPADEMVVTRGEREVRVWRKAANGGGGDGEWFLQSSVAYKNRAVDAFAVSPGTRETHSIQFGEFPVQGDPSGCWLGFADIKTKVAF